MTAAIRAGRPAPVDRLVLASASPRRKALLSQLPLPLPVGVLSSDTDETVEPGLAPPQIVEQLALRKARATLAMLEREPALAEGAASPLVLAADTIVVLDETVMGKPRDAADAADMLARLSGREHEVYTGVALLHAASGEADVRHRRTKVRMKALDSERIRRYVASGEPMDKAGSYAIQGIGAAFVEGIDGCYFNVVGLPLSLLADMLPAFGVDII